MNPLESVFHAIEVFNSTAVVASRLIAAVRHPDGSLTVVETLDQADATFAANQTAIDDWLAAHPEA